MYSQPCWAYIPGTKIARKGVDGKTFAVITPERPIPWKMFTDTVNFLQEIWIVHRSTNSVIILQGSPDM
jgi:hypothetical protein